MTWSELEAVLAEYLKNNPDVADSVIELILNPPNEDVAFLVNSVWDSEPLF